TLDKHNKSITEARKAQAAVQKPSLGILRRQIQQIDEDYADDEEHEASSESAVDSASRLFSPLGDEEQQLLTQMRAWGERATAQRDQKTQRLIAWLKDIGKPDGQWSDERVIIFTEYRATMNWLQE